MATTYAAEWTGVLGGYFRSYFIRLGDGCDLEQAPGERGKPEWRPIANDKCCLCLMPSKQWGTKYPEAPASGQTWCCHCFRLCKATWGVVIETQTLSGKLLYVRPS